MKPITEAIAVVIKDIYGADLAYDLSVSRPDPTHGDFATNVALQLAKTLARSPQDIAEQIASALGNNTLFSKVSVAGPGFINMRLSDKALRDGLIVSPKNIYEGQSVVVEYSDPNPFKVLHAGHLYTTFVGDAVARIIESAGATVHSVNFGGDVGLHVGRTMWAVLQELGGEYPEKLNEVATKDQLDWLSALYVKGSSAYENDEQAKAAIIELNKKVYRIHAENDHESTFAQIYWKCRTWSYDGFDRLYETLQVMPFEKYYPESMTTNAGVAKVQKGLVSGVFEQSDGAVVFRGEEHGLHTRVFVNSSGLPTYETKDLGLSVHKWDDYHFDRSIIITGNDITEYMKVVLKALSNFLPEAAERTTHFTHGQIKLAGGFKMSSRKGNILRADDVLVAASNAQEAVTNSSDHDVMLAAVKYAFLKQRIGSDIVYDPKESVAVEGNSGPYLQYAHARACSILHKAAKPGLAPMFDSKLNPSERQFVLKMGEYAEVVERAAMDLMPHYLCTYLYELAQEFNRFYEKNRILGEDQEVARLTLVRHYIDILGGGLTMLGITAPQKM